MVLRFALLLFAEIPSVAGFLQLDFPTTLTSDAKT